MTNAIEDKLDAIDAFDTEWFAAHTSAATAADLARSLEALILAGTVPVGTRLPTIRDFSRALEVSPGTVLVAWGYLREQGHITTHRRGGSRIAGTGLTPPPPAGRQVSYDLLSVAGDTRLQPPLANAVLSALDDVHLNTASTAGLAPRLQAAVGRTWPFVAQKSAAVGSASEALVLAILASSDKGDAIAVDEPMQPGLAEILQNLERRAIGVTADENGPVPAALAAALDRGAVSWIHQPGAPFSVHGFVTAERSSELGAALAARTSPAWVIENDPLGDLHSMASPSIGSVVPDRTIRIKAFCRAYGLDLKTTVVGGSAELVSRVEKVRSSGYGSSSRILQNTLAALLTNPGTESIVSRARSVYNTRKVSLSEALRARGLVVHSGRNSCQLWVEVEDETASLLTFAVHGITAGGGTRAFVDPPTQPLIRLSSMQAPDDTEELLLLADEIARAVLTPNREEMT